MKIVFWIFIILVPVVIGRGVLHLLYGKKIKRRLSWADALLTGWMICIGLAEAAYLISVIMKMSFTDCVFLFSACCFIFFLGAIILMKRCYKRDRKYEIILVTQVSQVLSSPSCFAVEFFILIQLFLIATRQNVVLDKDMTVETVNSFLSANAFYQVNPLTGMAYEAGMPFRLKILCLPALYGILCQIFHLETIELVWEFIPCAVLLGSYLAYGMLAERLFPESLAKRCTMLIAVGFLHFLGGMEGLCVMESGFQGTTILTAVVIPYLFSVILRKKWKIAIICILAELCIVWTLYGMGVCLLITAVMGVLSFVGKKKGKLPKIREVKSVCWK